VNKPSSRSRTHIAAVPRGLPARAIRIGRQPFVVLIRVDGVPNAVALAEIIAMPERMGPPILGARIRGEVIGHAEHGTK
jgi:hypothetical protein